MSNNDLQILMEHFDAKFDALTEAFVDMNQYMHERMATKEELEEVKTEVRVIRVALSDLSRVVNGHTDTLEQHGAMLRRHGVLLEHHSTLLEHHNLLLEHHGHQIEQLIVRVGV